MKKSLTIAVMCCTALSSVISTAAYADIVPAVTADPASDETLDAMQAQCDVLAAAHDIDGIDADVWTGEVVLGAVTPVSGPTEVPGSRVIDESTIEGAGSFTWGGVHIVGDPYRTGGSVNLFADQRATEKNYTDSTYTFDADFDSTFAHAFSCNIEVSILHPGQHNAGHPVIGHYIVEPTDQGDEEDTQQSCIAFSAHQPTAFEPDGSVQPPWWGEDHGQCVFVEDGPEVPPSDTEPYFDPPAFVVNEAGVPVNQTQTDSLTAFEDHGGPVTLSGDLFIDKVVVCISPSSTTKKGVPGEWRQQNGYTGDKCTTAWFNVAPWGGGSQTSNGTYISVPAV